MERPRGGFRPPHALELLSQPAVLERPVELDLEFLQVERCKQEVIRTLFERRDSRLEHPVRTEHENHGTRTQRGQGADQLQPPPPTQGKPKHDRGGGLSLSQQLRQCLRLGARVLPALDEKAPAGQPLADAAVHTRVRGRQHNPFSQSPAPLPKPKFETVLRVSAAERRA